MAPFLAPTLVPPRVSSVLDQVEGPIHVTKPDRLRYLSELVDLSDYSPDVVKMAVDGIYRPTDRQVEQLHRLAQDVAEAGGIATRFGRGTLIYRAVMMYKN